MNEEINLLPKMWEHLEKDLTPINRRVLKYLNKDILMGIYASTQSKRYYIESLMEVPIYVHKYIRKYCKSNGYTYLYD